MKANLLPGDEAVGKEAARYIRFASAAYGMLMLKVLVCFFPAIFYPACYLLGICLSLSVLVYDRHARLFCYPAPQRCQSCNNEEED